jgi:tetratricopeptide (TPR) repeat protein
MAQDASGLLGLLLPLGLFLIVAKGIDPLMVFLSLGAIVVALTQMGIIGEPQPQSAEGEAPTSRAKQAARRNGRRVEEEFEPQARTLPLEKCLSEAQRCLENNNYDRAEQLAKQATDTDAECAKAWELLATAQQWAGKRDEALATVRSALETFEVESEALEKLKRDLQSKSPAEIAVECEAKGKEFMTKRMYDLAIDCYNKAIDALEAAEVAQGDRPLFLRLRRSRAECAQQLQDWSLCRKDATVLLEEDPNDARALLQRAAANEALEKFKAALEDARKLLAIDPKNIAANRIVHNCNQALRG